MKFIATILLLTVNNWGFSQSTCSVDELDTPIEVGQTDVVPMGLFSGTAFSILDTTIIKLGYIENGLFVLGESGGTQADGNYFNSAKDTVAIVGISGTSVTIYYTDFHCSPTSGTVSYTVNTTLPVEWLKPLSVSERDKSIEISFSTAAETNNSHFEIQHSNSGRDFQSIGRIEGHGNSTSENHYQFIHKKPNEGTNYYRVKQVDYDGEYDYSNIAVVSHKPRSITFYPNPTTDNINLLLTEGKQVTIYTALGVVLDRLELEEGDQELSLKKYGQSILLLQVGEEWIRVVVE